MAGDNKPYLQQSMFWSDLGPKIGFEAIGVVDSELPTVGVFTKNDLPDLQPTGDDLANISVEKGEEKGVLRSPKNDDKYHKGVLFYLRDNIIVGIVLWNVFSKMQVARQVINEARSFEDVTEVAKLFELYAKPEEEDDDLN